MKKPFALLLLFGALTVLGDVEQRLELKAGWNLVSLTVEPADGSVASVFQGKNVGGVFGWWMANYAPVHTVEPGKGYWVYCENDATIVITGAAASARQITMTRGWNLIGPLPAYQVTPHRQIADLIMAWDADAAVQDYEQWNDPLYEAGRGYWVHAFSDVTIDFGPRTISGTVSGEVVEGVTLTLSGAADAQTLSAANGAYSFTDLLPGLYRVTPAAANVTFGPAARPGIVLRNADATGVDFTSHDNVADTSFLNQDPPGTYTFVTNGFAVQAQVKNLPPEAVASLSQAEGTITLSGRARGAYAVDDVLIGDADLRIAKKVLAVHERGRSTVLRVADAPLSDVLAPGASFTFQLKPDWSTASRSARGVADGRGLDQNDIDANGVIDLSNVSLLDLSVDADGVVDWAGSTLMGAAMAPEARPEALRHGRFAEGRTTADVKSGSLKVLPRWDLTYEADSRGGVSVSGTLQAHVVVDLEIEFVATGAVDCHFRGDLLPRLSVPVSTPTDPPVHLDLELEVPAGVRIAADAAGQLTLKCRSEYTLQANVSYDSVNGFSIDETVDKAYGAREVTPTADGTLSAELYLAPATGVRIYTRTGPRMWLNAYARAEATNTPAANADDLFVGLAGGVDLDSSASTLGNNDPKSGRLFTSCVTHDRWDLLGPQDGGAANNAPLATAVSSEASNSADAPRLLQLAASDADGDFLYYAVATQPAHGSVVHLNPSTGEAFHRPSAGFSGADSFTFLASDGLAQSQPATVTLEVLAATEPTARFAVAAHGLTAAFDASDSAADADTIADLQVRWDFDNDRTWDVDWTAAKTATHAYPAAGTVVAVCEVRNSAGAVDRARRVLDLRAAGSNCSPTAVFGVAVNGLTVSVDAGWSADNEDLLADLEVRWDWHGDRVWDTDWATLKTAEHAYSIADSHDVLLQVRDAAGNVSEINATVDLAATGLVGRHLVIDVSGGPDARGFPVTMLSSAPPGLLTDDAYKTVKIVLRRIAAGAFTMGSPPGEVGRYDPWETQHTVTLTQDFYIGVFEITQKQWEQVIGTTPSFFTGDKRPVEQVAWDAIRGGTWPGGDPGADAFAGKVRAKTGHAADLPTEGQWEYACRARSTAALNSGKNLTSSDSDANLAELGRYWHNGGSAHASDPVNGGSASVGGCAANAWGLYDMHGNVSEWCLDWHQADLGADPATDPTGPASGGLRTIRGGSWRDQAGGCRSASRNNYWPDGADSNIGFRLVVPAADR